MDNHIQEAREATLAQIGVEILRLFNRIEQECNKSATFHNETSFAQLFTQSERFDLWATSLGLHQSGHASLDYRFRDAPRIREYADSLLSNLRSSLAVSKSSKLH